MDEETRNLPEVKELIETILLVGPMVDSIMGEFVSKKKAANWILINTCLVRVEALERKYGGKE